MFTIGPPLIISAAAPLLLVVRAHVSACRSVVGVLRVSYAVAILLLPPPRHPHSSPPPRHRLQLSASAPHCTSRFQPTHRPHKPPPRRRRLRSVYPCSFSYALYNLTLTLTLYFKANTNSAPAALRRSATTNSAQRYMTGLSLFFGVSSFGGQGVLLGPLLFSLGLALYGKYTQCGTGTWVDALGCTSALTPCSPSSPPTAKFMEQVQYYKNSCKRSADDAEYDDESSVEEAQAGAVAAGFAAAGGAAGAVASPFSLRRPITTGSMFDHPSRGSSNPSRSSRGGPRMSDVSDFGDAVWSWLRPHHLRRGRGGHVKSNSAASAASVGAESMWRHSTDYSIGRASPRSGEGGALDGEGGE